MYVYRCITKLYKIIIEVSIKYIIEYRGTYVRFFNNKLTHTVPCAFYFIFYFLSTGTCRIFNRQLLL